MPTIHEHDRVVLARAIPAHGLIAGDVGTVVHKYCGSDTFEVEFASLTGETVAVVTVASDAVRPVARGEISHARQVA